MLTKADAAYQPWSASQRSEVRCPRRHRILQTGHRVVHIDMLTGQVRELHSGVHPDVEIVPECAEAVVGQCRLAVDAFEGLRNQLI